MLATASLTGTSTGIAARACSVGTSWSGITTHALDAFGGVQPNWAGYLVPVDGRADHEAPVERRADVVGVAFQLDGAGVDLLALEPQLEQVVGSHQARDDGRRRGAEAAGEWDLAANLEPQVIGRMKRLERPHAQVVAVVRHRLAARVDRELPGLGDLELQVQRERGGHHVVARPQVRGGGRNADQAAANGHRQAGGPSGCPGFTST